MYDGDKDLIQAVKLFENYIKGEILADEIIRSDEIDEKFDLNGHETKLKIQKV